MLKASKIAFPSFSFCLTLTLSVQDFPLFQYHSSNLTNDTEIRKSSVQENKLGSKSESTNLYYLHSDKLMIWSI